MLHRERLLQSIDNQGSIQMAITRAFKIYAQDVFGDVTAFRMNV